MALKANDSALVTVFDTERETEALVVKGLLESAGIETLIVSLDSPQDVFPGVGGVVVQVTQEQAAEAQAIIAEYRAHPVEDSEAAES
jgi:p-aminobenzoyl-glutamate transporter AbgT